MSCSGLLLSFWANQGYSLGPVIIKFVSILYLASLMSQFGSLVVLVSIFILSPNCNLCLISTWFYYFTFLDNFSLTYLLTYLLTYFTMNLPCHFSQSFTYTSNFHACLKFQNICSLSFFSRHIPTFLVWFPWTLQGCMWYDHTPYVGEAWYRTYFCLGRKFIKLIVFLLLFEHM